MDICQNLYELKKQLKDYNVKIVVISKTQPVETIKRLYLDCNHIIIGENKVQELILKYEQLKDCDIEWHMVGHLQRNKVKYIAPFISMIHSVDSLKLLIEINKHALKNNRIISCLLQFHIATEDTKFGLNIEECRELLNSDEFFKLDNIKICGVMGMATYTDDERLIRTEFKSLKEIFNFLKNNYFKDNNYFKEISMGMTNDWRIAAAEGSTMLRIGSLIFENN